MTAQDAPPTLSALLSSNEQLSTFNNLGALSDGEYYRVTGQNLR